MESFEGSGIFVTQPKISLQTTGIATQLLKIKDQYEYLVKVIITMESAYYIIKEAVQAIQELDFGEEHLQHQPLHSKKNAKQRHL